MECFSTQNVIKNLDFIDESTEKLLFVILVVSLVLAPKWMYIFQTSVNYKEYPEPFLGGGSVKAISQVPHITKKYPHILIFWVNDLYETWIYSLSITSGECCKMMDMNCTSDCKN